MESLERVEFPLEVPGATELRLKKDALATQLSTRLLPHLEQDNVPTLVVFGGSSGAGKSTLTNSILGEDVTEASIIRPTTRTPVVVYHTGDEAAMAGHGVAAFSTMVATDNAISSLAIIDAPDLDSIDDENRELSDTLMNVADLWVFVTTASRYGDNVAWSALTEAHARGLTVAVVLNRLPARAKKAVRADLMTRMNEAGLGDAPLFIIDDAGPLEERLDEAVVAELRSWLELIARQHRASSPAYRTARSVLPAMRSELGEIADGAAFQVEMAEMLIADAEGAVAGPTSKLDASLKAGRLAAGAPTTRWLTLASSGGVLAPLVAGKKGLLPALGKDKRDRAVMQVADAIDDALTVSLEQALADSKEAVTKAWEFGPVDTTNLKVHLSTDIIERAIGAWHDDSLETAGRTKAEIAKRFSNEGYAALLRAAAGGVSGARKIVPEGALTQVETSLRDRCRAAVKEISDAYAGRIKDIRIPDATKLRIRAAELVNSVWEDQ